MNVVIYTTQTINILTLQIQNIVAETFFFLIKNLLFIFLFCTFATACGDKYYFFKKGIFSSVIYNIFTLLHF